MNNKRGGVGAKILLVLILMIASAIGGAYGYRVLDGKLAVRDAQKTIEIVRLSDYDTPESTEVQSLIDNAKKYLETASTRKEVYEIIEDFNSDLSKIQTKTQKELEQALKDAEEARKNNNNNSNNSNNNNNYYNNDDDYYNNSNNNGNNSNGSSDTNNSNNNSNNSNSNSNSGNSNNSNNSNGNSSAITNDDGSGGRSGLLSNLLGGSDD